MKLRSNKVFYRRKPKVNSCIKNQTFSERRLSLRSGKPNCGKREANGGEIGSCGDDCEDNLETGMKKGVNTDDKGLFLGSEVLDPVEDLVVSCHKEEIEEGEGNESVSNELNATGLGFNEEVKSPHVDCENGSKSLGSKTSLNDPILLGGCKEIKSPHGDCEIGSKSSESKIFADDTMIVDSNDKETSLNDPGNVNILGKCKEMKEKRKRGRKKKNVGNLKKIGSNQEKLNSDDNECMLMPLKRKRGKKKKNVGNLKKIGSNKEKLNSDDDECMLMPLKRKRGRKKKKVPTATLR